MRYDAAIIGAGGEGVFAALALAAAGRPAVLIDRAQSVGGRFRTSEFQPGFFAHAFAEALPPLPPAVLRLARLAEAGLFFEDERPALALWPDGRRLTLAMAGGAPRLPAFVKARLAGEVQGQCARAAAVSVPARGVFAPRQPSRAWPPLSGESIAAALGMDAEGEAGLALAACGHGLDPFAAYSALHLTGGARSLAPLRLAAVLEQRLAEAGVTLILDAEIGEIGRTGAAATSVILADGRVIEARAVLSTLDVKQTFLSFFAWNTLPKSVVARTGAWRMGTSQARLLCALRASPADPALREAGRIVVPLSFMQVAAAHAASREGTVAPGLPLTLTLPSARDPAAAPAGSAVLSITAASLPLRLFDGGWTHERREALRAQMLHQAEAVLPGLAASILGSHLIAPPDLETGLGATGGDPFGGEFAPDQWGALRPWSDGPLSPRTPLAGLYLAGGSTPAAALATGLSGMLAAEAILADLNSGRLR